MPILKRRQEILTQNGSAKTSFGLVLIVRYEQKETKGPSLCFGSVGRLAMAMLPSGKRLTGCFSCKEIVMKKKQIIILIGVCIGASDKSTAAIFASPLSAHFTRFFQLNTCKTSMLTDVSNLGIIMIEVQFQEVRLVWKNHLQWDSENHRVTF